MQSSSPTNQSLNSFFRLIHAVKICWRKFPVAKVATQFNLKHLQFLHKKTTHRPAPITELSRITELYHSYSTAPPGPQHRYIMRPSAGPTTSAPQTYCTEHPPNSVSGHVCPSAPLCHSMPHRPTAHCTGPPPYAASAADTSCAARCPCATPLCMPAAHVM